MRPRRNLLPDYPQTGAIAAGGKLMVVSAQYGGCYLLGRAGCF